jgi:tetratricopeptide (TPR) repeat protein
MDEAVGLHRAGKLREAEKIYARIVKAAPDYFDALHIYGSLKAQSGQMGEALRLINAALKINPRSAEALVNLSNVMHALKRDQDALDCLDKALAIKPDDPLALGNRGSALLTLNRPEDALASFEALLRLDPRNGEAMMNRGIAKAALLRHDEALADFDAALAVMPGHPNALYNRGSALLALGRPTEALAEFERTLAAFPAHPRAWNNRGRALQQLNRYAEAVQSFDKVLALQKDDADAHSNRALSLLTLGELREGFRQYEWRWKRSGMRDTRRGYNKPLWLGEFPLGNKTILLTAEQGLGDTIQFARYAALLARSGAKVVLEVPPELKALLSGLDGVAACVARDEPLPAYDVHCPLGSLPLALKTDATDIPADIPYLHADAAYIAKWRPKLDALPGKRIAIAWAGQIRHANDRNRSIDFKMLEPLLALKRISFVSIQRELRGDDAALLANHANVTHVGSDLDDMADTAAVLALCDLLISVDTSVAHLAGAMARPAWVMLPFAPDWRWGLPRDPEKWEPVFGQDRAQNKSGEHSAWYPQVRLFRQPALGDWPSAIAHLRDALADFAGSSS